VFDGGSETGIDVSVVQFPVENEKVGIVADDRRNRFSIWPWRLLIEFLSESIESIQVSLSRDEATDFHSIPAFRTCHSRDTLDRNASDIHAQHPE
jgi:hypothetical protein